MYVVNDNTLEIIDLNNFKLSKGEMPLCSLLVGFKRTTKAFKSYVIAFDSEGNKYIAKQSRLASKLHKPLYAVKIPKKVVNFYDYSLSEAKAASRKEMVIEAIQHFKDVAIYKINKFFEVAD